MCPCQRAHWRHLANTIELVLPPESTTQTANRSVQPFLHSSRHKVSILYNGRLFPPKIAPSRGGIWPPSNSRFLAPDRAYSPNGILIVSAVFARVTAECPYTLLWDAPFPSKLPLPIGGSGPPSNTWFPWPTRVLNPNCISIGSAVLAGLTSVTDRQTLSHRQTDRPRYSAGNNGPHLRT